ncbi:MAG TPA: biopolymer transporter ExbD [Candidatus Goldiibacteriota bacterium]|nr:biopolymer transporter ExbD [Candidatus Goldiibacteriota bacterium]
MLKRREKERLISEINITPLTDVMLVLLIIFMVTTPFIVQGNIKINLPSAKSPSDEAVDKNIIVGLSADGKVYLNGVEIKSDADLSAGIKAAIAKTGNNTVIIEGDKMAFHGEMVKIMGLAKDAGAGKLAITTIPEAEREKLIKQ